MLKQRHKFTQSLDTNVEFHFKEFFILNIRVVCLLLILKQKQRLTAKKSIM